jgi:hypothetical protein
MDFRRDAVRCRRCRRGALVLGAMLLLPLGGCVAFFRGPSRPPEPLPVAPFLDLHCHVAGLGAGGSGCLVSERLRRSWKVGFMQAYPNLYADISSLTQINKLSALREVLRRPEFRGRLVYGTDFPMINMPIVSPWYFPLDLSLRQRWRISRIKNPWDRDVALKQALGVPANVFTRAENLLRL